MRKKSKKIIALALAAVTVFVLMIALIPGDEYSKKTTTVVTVENSKASPEYLQTVVEIRKSGNYIFNPDWLDNDKPGFLTGFSVADESGKIIYSIAGGLLKNDSAPVELAAGKYTCRFDYICSSEDLSAYALEYSANAAQSPVIGEIPGASDWFADGTWEMSYSLKVFQANRFSDIISISAGVILGLLLVALIVTISRDENATVQKYDERQVAEQGKAYKYGFYAMFAYLTILAILSDVLSKYAETKLLIFIGILVGGAVTVTYSILHDAYFRLDESRRFYSIFFAFISIFNIGLGIIQIVRGHAFEEGVLTFTGCMNLICGIFILYVMIVLLIKKLHDREES